MSESNKAPNYLWQLFTQLRRRQFLLGLDDYEAVRQAIRLGFGWKSKQDFLDLLCCLWAKSKAEKEILTVLFEQETKNIEDWLSTSEVPKNSDVVSAGNEESSNDVGRIVNKNGDQKNEGENESDLKKEPTKEVTSVIKSEKYFPEIPKDVELPQIPLIMLPEYPVSEREIAQSWRRLRRLARIGPAVELDIDATIAKRVKRGVAVDVALRPRRRNTTRLLLLVDQYGSMTPYRQFVEMACHAIRRASNLYSAELYYFHDVPVHSDQLNDWGLLIPLKDMLFPVLDPILSKIQPSTSGSLFEHSTPVQKYPLQEILDKYANGAAIVIISDAGAARGNYDFKRLFDTVAFLKVLKNYTNQVVWLNPVQRVDWKYGTVKQIQRYIPMFEMDKEGFYRAVDVLRGHPYFTEPLL